MEIKKVKGVITGFYQYGNGIIFRIGARNKIKIPLFLLRKKLEEKLNKKNSEDENKTTIIPASFLGLKIKAQGIVDRYYGGKFKIFITIRKKEDFQIEEKVSPTNKDSEKSIEEKAKKILTAVGKKSLYENLKKKGKLATFLTSPFHFCKNGKIDFLTALAIHHLTQGNSIFLPTSACGSALSWLFWEEYREKAKGKISVKEACKKLEKVLGMKLPSVQEIIDYCKKHHQVCFLQEEVRSLEENTKEESTENTTKNANKNTENTENKEKQEEKIFYCDWQYFTIKKFVLEKLEEFFPDTIIETTKAVDENGNLILENATSLILSNKAIVITGGPGTGKSTTIKLLAKELEKKGKKCLLTGTTGNAASQIAGITTAKAFGFGYFNGKKKRKKDIPQTPASLSDVIFIDEASLLDTISFYRILKFLKPEQKLVLSGDPRQQSPVEGEEIFHTILEMAEKSGRIIKLIKAHRFQNEEDKNKNKEDSSHLQFSNSLLNSSCSCGLSSFNSPKSVLYLVESEQMLYPAIASIFLFLTREKKINPEEILFTTPYHRTIWGTRKINFLIKKLIQSLNQIDNQKLKFADFLYRLKMIFKTGDAKVSKLLTLDRGDKVLITKNIYEGEKILCSNKDTGTVISIEDDKTAFVEFRQRKGVILKIPQKDLYHAYCIEFFSSQGSEAEYCITLLPPHFIQQNLMEEKDPLIKEKTKKSIFVATTRAKKNTFILSTTRLNTDFLKRDLKDILNIVKTKTLYNLEVLNTLLSFIEPNTRKPSSKKSHPKKWHRL